MMDAVGPSSSQLSARIAVHHANAGCGNEVGRLSFQMGDLAEAQADSVLLRDEYQDLEGDEEEQEFEPSSVDKNPKPRAKKLRHRALLEAGMAAAAEKRIVQAVENEDHNAISLRAIMAKQQSSQIISTPREYQMELFHRAKQQNTIAVLPTGSGKTLIAVLLLRHTIDQELEARAASNAPRVSFFMTVTVALAFQQHRVLLSNIDQPAALVVGHMDPESWDKATWSKLLEGNMVVVCTPDVLLHALFRSFLSMDDINFLVFDEAHHAKKSHPYAKIVRDFYIPQAYSGRCPRIFGMTASPVDVNLDSQETLTERAGELELLLHSRIATASSTHLLEAIVAPPDVSVIFFSSSDDPGESELFQKLRKHFVRPKLFEELFTRAEEVRKHLGSWCSDHFWSLVFSEAVLRKRENKILRDRKSLPTEAEVKYSDDQIAQLHQAKLIIEFSPSVLSVPALDLSHVSLKVKKLFDLLERKFSCANKSKCLVFVERRDTARLLFTLTEQLGTRHLRPGVITGANFDKVHAKTNSIREQALTLMKFRNEELNCLFATSIAEEGIDIPDCNLVIRFDPCKTLIQYIQSRGRARHIRSSFFHLVQRDSRRESEKLLQIKDAEVKLQQLCQTLPEDRKIDPDQLAWRNSQTKVYVEPRTGAKLTYEYSLVVLQHFVSSIPAGFEEDSWIIYDFRGPTSGPFVCEVILPPQCPFRSVTGLECPRKAIAKRSAAYEACLLLRAQNHIDEHFLPNCVRKVPALGNARLALSHASEYTLLSKPNFWQEGSASLPDKLYLSAIGLTQAWDRPTRALGLLTRIPMPGIPTFPIYQSGGGASDVVITLKGPIQVTSTLIHRLTWFSLTIFQDLFNKTFENEPRNFPYWLAPLTCAALDITSSLAEATAVIDWDFLEENYLKDPYPWTEDMPGEYLVDKFLVDPWDGGRRFFTKCIAMDLGPSDLVPAESDGSCGKETIIGYSIRGLFKKSKETFKWTDKQPVVEAETMMSRLDLLSPPTQENGPARTKCFICPEPLRISRLPTDLAAAYRLLPAIIHRIESYLIALEFCTGLGFQVTPALALEAITKDVERTDGPDENAVVFRRGMGPNYERLEFLGDTFLKMATSISVFVKDSSNEYGLHVRRMAMLCNKNLLDTAIKNGWYKYVRCESFSRRKWYPPNVKLEAGKGKGNQAQQAPIVKRLGDKTIADICEAMIGAVYITHFQDGFNSTAQFDSAVDAIYTFVASEDHSMKKWNDYYEAYEMPQCWKNESTASQRDLVRQLAEKLPYKFNLPRIARSAFQHPSQPESVEKLPCYQRLEFLGDALLDMTIVDFLFRRFPDKGPHWLTQHKMPMVSNRFLGVLCVRLGLYKHLRHSQSQVEKDVREFVADVEAAEIESNGRLNFWTMVREGPKCLSDIVESYIGAMFIDSKFDYGVVQQFFDDNIRGYFEDFSAYEDFIENSPATKLHSFLRHQMRCYDSSLMAQDMSSVDISTNSFFAAVIIHDKIVGECHASTFRGAKMGAAEKALDATKNESRETFRRRYGCDCDFSKQDEVDEAEEFAFTI